MLVISKNTKDTEEIAKDFLDKIKPAESGATIVGLYGELGTGKTTFTQAVARILGVKRKVNSPTFVIMKKYELPNKKLSHKNFLASKYLFHLDAYRLKNEKELLHLGWEEIIADPKNLIFIEWPEMIIKAMPKKHYKILIAHTKEGHRKFKIKNS